MSSFSLRPWATVACSKQHQIRVKGVASGSSTLHVVSVNSNTLFWILRMLSVLSQDAVKPCAILAKRPVIPGQYRFEMTWRAGPMQLEQPHGPGFDVSTTDTKTSTPQTTFQHHGRA